MTRGAWLFSLVLVSLPLHAQQAASTPSQGQKAGERLYLQRCALCHSGTAPLFETYGPPLTGSLVTSLGDERIRKVIMDGSSRMPGFRYGHTEAQISNIVEYLKTKASNQR